MLGAHTGPAASTRNGPHAVYGCPPGGYRGPSGGFRARRGLGGATGWCAPEACYGPVEYSKVGSPACMVSTSYLSYVVHVVKDGAVVVDVEPSEISSDIISLYSLC